MTVEELLKPISPDKPCGEEDSIFQLEKSAAGKPEDPFTKTPAQDPNWKELRELSLDSFKRSKHLTTSVILTLALMKTEGFTGLRDGLALVRGLLEQYWEQVHPQLDPDDPDPLQRINILNNLGSYSEPYRFILRLEEVPLGHSAQFGPVKLKDILASKDKTQEAALRDTKPDLLKANFDAVSQALDNIRLLETFLTTTVGAGHTPNLEELTKGLKTIKNTIAPLVGGQAEESPAAGGAAPATAGGTAAPAARNGKIASRDDVLRVLDEVCEYYTRFEPASPIPFIIKRAQRMVKMNFIEIINELTPDSITQVKVITGPDPNEPPPAS